MLRVKCLHGYFILEETKAGQVSKFMSLFGLSLVPKDNYFTFEALVNAPDYSIINNAYLGATATKTVEGEPWQIMRANGLVYNFNTDKVMLMTAVTQKIKVERSGNFFISQGLILPGSIKEDGSRVTDYAAWYSFDTARFRYTEVTYE